MKTYVVEYVEKYDCMEHSSSMEVEADNAVDARAKCVKLNQERTGRHAFRPVAKVKKNEPAEKA